MKARQIQRMQRDKQMEITFDIGKDELPIFLAEVDEHLQVLDNNLLRLQKQSADGEIMQTVFRSAHTIKGMAGMIGHRRMTSITHVLENALDGVRKNTLPVSMPLINLCLRAVDCLRLLREEVATSLVSNVDVEEVVSAFGSFVAGECEELPNAKNRSTAKDEYLNLSNSTLQICAKIDTNSMASAARAFQLMMILEDLGDIRKMTPSQEEIESASSVGEFSAELVTEQSLEKVCASLTKISGVNEITINGIVTFSEENPCQGQGGEQKNGTQPKVQTGEAGESPLLREKRNTDAAGRRVSDLTLRMSIEHMDHLMNLVGELITDRNHLQQFRGHNGIETNLNENIDPFLETITHLGRITDQLQEEVMSIRMLPIGSLFNRFPRMVHDMCQKVGKSIELVVHGEDTEMDRSMIETIYDPLIHIIRNSVDHGVELPQDRIAYDKPETGTITLTARHEQGRIVVTVEDDGRGIDADKLRSKAVQKGLITAEEAASLSREYAIDLMFMPGLSTVDEATEYSGRGVGLDIVKTNIQRVNGVIQVESEPGHGTQFQISLPLTLAIVPALLVRVQQSVFAIPMIMITETLRLKRTDVKYANRKPVTLLRGSVLPLVSLSEIFGRPSSNEENKYLFAVVIKSGKQQVGLLVDSLIGEEEVVVKPLGSFVGEIPGISSATILGNGQVALIIDVFHLFKLMGM
jgi:two-component system, chemotaxis family, sensor kinase CheA